MLHAFNFTSVLLFQLSFLAISCNAQNDAFGWGFSNNFVSTTLEECQSLDINILALNGSFGTPPYYMMAMEVGGIPTTTLVGENRSAVSWVVTHAAGVTLMLSMIDSNKSAGGVAPILYSVVAGSDQSCLPPPPAYDFIVTTNVTDTLTTCQPWGLTISGGVQPYTVTLAELDSPIITNVTLGPLDDAFTFIDRADPNTRLIAAISDSNGNFAKGTPLVHTKGSANVDCTGLVSSSGNATAIAQAAVAAAAAAAAQSRKRASTKIAVAVTLVLLFLAGVGIFAYLHIRKRNEILAAANGQDTVPRQFAAQTNANEALTISAPLTFDSFQRSSTSSSRLQYTAHRHDSSCPPFCASDIPHYPSRFPSNRSDMSPIRPSKADEANGRFMVEVRRTTSTTPFQPRARMQSLPNRSASASVGRPRRPSGSSTAEPDVIYQHRDGGEVVQELPPPYLDRSSTRAGAAF